VHAMLRCQVTDVDGDSVVSGSATYPLHVICMGVVVGKRISQC